AVAALAAYGWFGPLAGPSGVVPQPPAGESFIAAEGPIRAGAARVEITPVVGGYLAGFAQGRTSQAVHDPLYARAVVMETEAGAGADRGGGRRRRRRQEHPRRRARRAGARPRPRGPRLRRADRDARRLRDARRGALVEEPPALGRLARRRLRPARGAARRRGAP